MRLIALHGSRRYLEVVKKFIGQLRHVRCVETAAIPASAIRLPSSDARSATAKETALSNYKFIPMTRKTLIRKLVEDPLLVSDKQKDNFMKFVESLEAVLSVSVYGKLAELKQLYDPLNPDKETMSLIKMGDKERLDHEFWLLDKFSKLLRQAHFVELSKERVMGSLSEHPSLEGVLVMVDLADYDVLRFWALGEETIQWESHSLMQQIEHYVKVRFLGWPKEISRYKRVVLAVRTKKQKKLMLKAFKDVPVNGLEYFLPEGKIRMSRFDQGFIASTVSVGVVSVLVKIVSSLADYDVQWPYILSGITGLLAFKAWNAYKNKRNKYLINLSRFLYFKTVANNRALLSVIVDRAEDELFKSVLLAYTFSQHKKECAPGVVNEDVERWMEKLKINLHFNSKEPLGKLMELGLVSSTSDEAIRALPIEEALRLIPPAIKPFMTVPCGAFEVQELDIVEDELPPGWS